MSNTLKLIGWVVGESSPTEFIFVANKENHPPKYEYVIVSSKEHVDGKVRKVFVLAQVVGIISKSSVFREDLDYESLERIYKAGIDDSNVLCIARTLGFLNKKGNNVEVLMPRRAIYPGNKVYLAPDNLVKEFFSFPEEEGLKIGYLVSRPHIPIYISINGLRRHLAILAQTGAGKSYTAGVLIEELFRKGATIIVIDPHADYVFMNQRDDGSRVPFADRIIIFRNPESTGRYSEKDVLNLKEYTIKFSELNDDELFEILEIPERYVKIREVIGEALRELRENMSDYSANDFIDKLREFIDNVNKRKKIKISIEAVRSAFRRAKKLFKLKVFGEYTTSVDEFLNPMQVSVIDLSGLNDPSMDYIVWRILSDIYNVITTGKFNYPVFIVIEEAHRFVRANTKSFSKGIINTIASEGRKFGLFLILISQRPFKIDSDSLSQCNSQIILRISNPKDQEAIITSSERLSERLLKDLPGLNIGEAVIVGEITRVPVIVKIRKRETKQGGADIDVVSKLKNAKEEINFKYNISKKNEIIEADNTLLSEV